MKTRSIVPIALAALVLGALPAAADHRAPQRRDDRLAALSHELERATHDLYRDFAQRGRVRSLVHWRTAAALRHLDEHARRFHVRVERQGARNAQAQREFRHLEEALAVARHRAADLHGGRSLRHGFERVAALVSRVDTRLAHVDGRGRRDHHGRDLARRDGDSRGRYAAITWTWRY
jgi:hypothetical protein